MLIPAKHLPCLLHAQYAFQYRDAIERMLANGASGAVVVADKDGKRRVVGVLSETDLLWKGKGAPEVR